MMRGDTYDAAFRPSCQYEDLTYHEILDEAQKQRDRLLAQAREVQENTITMDLTDPNFEGVDDQAERLLNTTRVSQEPGPHHRDSFAAEPASESEEDTLDLIPRKRLRKSRRKRKRNPFIDDEAHDDDDHDDDDEQEHFD